MGAPEVVGLMGAVTSIATGRTIPADRSVPSQSGEATFRWLALTVS